MQTLTVIGDLQSDMTWQRVPIMTNMKFSDNQYCNLTSILQSLVLKIYRDSCQGLFQELGVRSITILDLEGVLWWIFILHFPKGWVKQRHNLGSF